MIIDKYCSKKGGKLFACFVDYRKAFDSVKHAGKINYCNLVLEHNFTMLSNLRMRIVKIGHVFSVF